MNMKQKRFTRKALSLALTAALSAGCMTPVLAENASIADSLTDAFSDIEIEYRPDVRWWLAEGLNTDETLLKNLQEIYDSGFGAAEFLAMPDDGADSAIYGWGSEEWNSDTQLIINAATELGLGYSLTSGTHWSNANLPDTYEWDGQIFNADSKAASKELDYATIVLDAGESFDGVLPYAVEVEAEGNADLGITSAAYTENVFQGVVAAKVISARENAGEDYAEGEGTGELDFASLTDLTENVEETDEGYQLSWTAPDDGEYALFVYWMHGTGQTASPSVSTNYTINYMDSYGVEALIDYWEEYVLTDEVRAALEESGRGEIYMDSLEVSTYGAGGLFWGYNFKQEFADRMGYDITPYLPLIVADSGAQSGSAVKNYDYEPASDEDLISAEKIRTDYYEVMTDMYIENVLEPLQSWLHTLNMSLRAEPSYGFNFEISEPAAYLDDVETETFAQNGEIDLYRAMLGSANMYGRLFSCETGAVFGRNYTFNMDDWTECVYSQFVNGINRVVFHGYSGIEGSEDATYWPGHEGMYAIFSERFNSRQPASEFYPEWTNMLAVNQKALRQGTASRDIAILRTDYSFINYGFPEGMDYFAENLEMNDLTYFWNDLELQQNGYTYDYFSASLLEDEDNVSWTDKALQPDGAGYQAIILYQEEINLADLEIVAEIAESGLPVFFVNNNTELEAYAGEGFTNEEAASRSWHYNESDEEVQALAAQIKELPNVLTVDSPADAMEALQELGVYPRVGYTEANDKILTIERNDAENDLYYIFAFSYKYEVEEGSDPYTVTFSVEGEGKPYEIDDWTGTASEISDYTVEDGRTYITRTFENGEAALMVLDMNGDTSEVRVASSTADKTILEDGTISILASSSGEYETTLTNGETVTSSVTVPDDIELAVWDIDVEDWNEGDKVVNTEEKFGHTTEEVYYETKKTDLNFAESELVPWKDLPATEEQLASLGYEGASMSDVSGIATYTASFELPEDWSEENGAYIVFENTNGCMAQVYINGEKADGLDLRTLKLDISDLLVAGTNTVEIRVASTLTNRLLQKGYADLGVWSVSEPEDFVQDYGLTGVVTIEPYTVAAVA